MVLRHCKLNVVLFAAVAVMLLGPALSFAAPGTFTLVSAADCKVTCDNLEDCKAVCEESSECQAICEALEKGTLTRAEALAQCREACSGVACEVSCEKASADCCSQQAKVQKVSATAASSCRVSSGSTCAMSTATKVAVQSAAKTDKGV